MNAKAGQPLRKVAVRRDVGDAEQIVNLMPPAREHAGKLNLKRMTRIIIDENVHRRKPAAEMSATSASTT
jgi:hypothetical protein